VHKDFDLHAGDSDNLPDLLEREFPGQNDTGEAEFTEGAGPCGVMNGHLRAGVQNKAREMVADQAGDAEILHDHTVGSEVVERVKNLDELRQLGVFNQRVDRHIDPFARREGSGISQQDTQAVGGEIVGIGTRRELRQPQIDRVGTILECGQSSLETACGS